MPESSPVGEAISDVRSPVILGDDRNSGWIGEREAVSRFYTEPENGIWECLTETLNNASRLNLRYFQSLPASLLIVDIRPSLNPYRNLPGSAFMGFKLIGSGIQVEQIFDHLEDVATAIRLKCFNSNKTTNARGQRERLGTSSDAATQARLTRRTCVLAETCVLADCSQVDASEIVVYSPDSQGV
ncbi:hypothetical protein B0H10DRAFT_1969000 [Mycena sp. CBHHK59/15]|nr:hypothetical protein B0H10DRAFT_1969000 [Mycena sp. CBHHK59/15]